MRSLLFVPGDSERKIDKALGGTADIVIFDLEDSVAPDNKPVARELVAERLKSLSDADRAGLPAFYVRTNALDTGLTKTDVHAVLPGRPDGIMQPKTVTGDDVLTLADMIGRCENENGIDAGHTGVIAIVTETAASLFGTGTYAKAAPRLRAMTWGAEDLSADLGAISAKDDTGAYTHPYVLARSLCLAGAVAAGVEPVDTVFVNFRDEQGLRAECDAALRDGFTGKMAIHPDQVPVINEVFTPSGDAVARARRIVEAFAGAGDIGVVAMDGEMLDRPHLSRAEELIARAERYGG